MHFKYSLFAILDFVSKEQQDALHTRDSAPPLPGNIPSLRYARDPIAQGMWRLPGTHVDRLGETDIDPIAQLVSAVRNQTGIAITRTKVIYGMHQVVKKIPRPQGAVHKKKYTHLTKYYYVPLLFDDFIDRTSGGLVSRVDDAELNLDFSPEQICQHKNYYQPHQAVIRTLSSNLARYT